MAVTNCITVARGDEYVTLPQHAICELIFVAAQLRTRLAARAGAAPGRIDRTVLDNAAIALTNLRAALELARGRILPSTPRTTP